MGERGFEATTLRDIAGEAGVSAGLLYRYFPSKLAVLMALYDQLSADFEREAATMPEGRWAHRFVVALSTNLQVLAPHRVALRGLIPVLVGDANQGVFSESSAFSRRRVQGVFEAAVRAASDAPKSPLADAVGRLLYLLHLLVLLWWLLDRSPHQRATSALVSLLRQILSSMAIALRLPPVRRFVTSLEALVSEALLGGARPA
jgi:AcrR family transcriptional regulator